MSEAPSSAIMLFGTEEKVVPRKRLRAGPLACELDGGNLRYIRIGGSEAIRAIAFIVRDKDYGRKVSGRKVSGTVSGTNWVSGTVSGTNCLLRPAAGT